jgi:RNA polymerase sigma-70 factor (ECF subfamily)
VSRTAFGRATISSPAKGGSDTTNTLSSQPAGGLGRETGKASVYTFPPRHSLKVGMGSVRNSPGGLSIREDLAVGDSAASFEEFFRAEQLRLHRVLFAITGSRPEAEDIGQEAFLKVWERWDRVSEMDDPAGYLHRTAINVFRDRSRRLVLATKRAVRISGRPDEYEALEARSVAASVLGSLSPRQRAAIVLTEALGYSAEEAGKLLGIKGSTVRALHFQARSTLRSSKETIDG